MNTFRTLGVILAVGGLALAGCTSDSSDDTAPVESATMVTETTPTATAELTTDPIATSPGISGDQTDTAPTNPATAEPTTPGQAPGTPATTNNASSTDIPGWDELPPDPVGKDTTIAGETATICIYGDGWGTNIWAGNANTSCEFVSEVHQELIEGLNPTMDSIRQNLRPEITVTSPVTGEPYDLTCEQRSERLMACSGGNDAVVYIY